MTTFPAIQPAIYPALVNPGHPLASGDGGAGGSGEVTIPNHLTLGGETLTLGGQPLTLDPS
jgi:hypothetical protein